MRPDNPSPSSPLLPADSGEAHLPLALLRQYVAGTLPAAEQYRVERHTQACPRCADVLDGLAQTDLATTDQAISNLKTRLRTRVAELQPDTKPTVVPMWPWRQLAAVVLLLLVGTAVWLGVRRPTEGPAAVPRLAQRRAQPKTYATAPAPPAPTQTPTPVEQDAIAAAPNAVPPPTGPMKIPARRPTVVRRPREPVPVADLSEAEAAGSIAMESPPSADYGVEDRTSATASEVATEEVGKEKAADQAKRKSSSSVAAASAGRAAAPAAPLASAPVRESNRMANAAPVGTSTRTVRGRITDRNSGEGLSGVTVTAKGTATSVRTAADGSFTLAVPGSAKGLAFALPGYNSTEQPVPTDTSALALTLAPRPALANKKAEEPVLVRREPAPAPVALAAMPVGGQRAFRNYLRDNLEYPEKALKEEKEGSVKLSFVVNVDGTLQDIKVLRGLTEECDAEAIRLLKEGPAWHAAIVNGRRTARTVQISIPFRIADVR